MSVTWSVIVFNLVFGVGDIVGKYSVEIDGIYNKTSLIFLVTCRIIFAFPITFMAAKSDLGDPLTNNVIFPFVNAFLFAITNGFIISNLFLTKTHVLSGPS